MNILKLDRASGLWSRAILLLAAAGFAVIPATAQPAPLAPPQLDDLVAPIALYPDPLLSQVLVATTYPLEVVEAQQWLQQNRGVSRTCAVLISSGQQ